MNRVHIRISGMHCNQCVRAVETALTSLAGVRQAHVSVGEAEVLLDESQIVRADLMDAIRQSGDFDIMGFRVCE